MYSYKFCIASKLCILQHKGLWLPIKESVVDENKIIINSIQGKIQLILFNKNSISPYFLKNFLRYQNERNYELCHEKFSDDRH